MIDGLNSSKIAQAFKPAVTPPKAAPVQVAQVARPMSTPVMNAFSGRSDFSSGAMTVAQANRVTLDGGGGRRSPVSIAQSELAGAAPEAMNGSRYYGWAKTGRTDWCASFVCWTYAQSGIHIGPSPYGAQGVNGIPHCDNLKRWFEETPEWRWNTPESGYQPVPGDVVLFDYDGDGSMDHTGIVESYNPETGEMVCIEGNVGGDDQAGNGDGTLVRRTYSNMDDVAGFGHYAGTPAGGGGGTAGGNRALPIPV